MSRPRMPRCAAWCGGIPARITRRCCGAWPRRAASKRRVPRIRFDRTRKGKTLSNADWASPPDARIARMKDGTTHLAYKPEHAVDLDTGVIVAIHPADQGDTHTLAATLEQAMLDLVGLAPTPETPAEMIADKGYHSREGLIPFRKNYVRRNPGRPKRCRPPMATLQFRIGMKALEDSAWKSRISEKEQKASPAGRVTTRPGGRSTTTGRGSRARSPVRPSNCAPRRLSAVSPSSSTSAACAAPGCAAPGTLRSAT